MLRQLLIIFLSIIFITNTFATATIKKDVDYIVIDNKIKVDKNKPINVKEFFSYTCIHCKDLEPLIDDYQAKNKIDLERIHIVWGDDKTIQKLAQLNETIVAMKKSKELNPKIFQDIFANKNLTDETTLKDFLQKNRIDVDKFMGLYNSFDINQKVAIDKQLTSDVRYNITGTPTIIVADKYIIKPALPNRLIEVLDYLVKISK